jgi:hypothetical protein
MGGAMNSAEEPIALVASRQSVDETTAIFQRLRKLKADCGFKPSKNDLAVVLISACIEEGLDTGPRIVGALAKLGLNKSHAGLTLRQGAGQAEAHRWFRDGEGRYHLHDDGVRGSTGDSASLT